MTMILQKCRYKSLGKVFQLHFLLIIFHCTHGKKYVKNPGNTNDTHKVKTIGLKTLSANFAVCTAQNHNCDTLGK